MTETLNPHVLAGFYEKLGITRGSKVAVAVSGGADSMALLALSAPIMDVTAITVDHGLRSEAADEARWVEDQCRALGVPHVTLCWDGEKPTANLQAAAREARYNLMSNWCRSHDISYLAAAHHMDDQAETVLLRLARGSGVYGLAGMAPTRSIGGGVTLVRPFLGVQKTDLVDYLESESMDWIEDPSNQSHAFDRVKVRAMLADPPLEGFSARRLSDTADRMRRSRDALEFYEKRWLKSAADYHDEGHVTLRVSALTAEPEEVVLRGLASICRYVGRGMYVPRMEKLLRLYEALQSPSFKGQTLYGAHFVPNSDGTVFVVREVAAAEGPRPLTEKGVWDERFSFTVSGTYDGLAIAAVGEAGWVQLKQSDFDVAGVSLSRTEILPLAAIYNGEQLMAVPQIGYNVLEAARVTISLKAEK